MNGKRPPEGIETGKTDGGATSYDHMHGRETQGRSGVWGSEEERASQRAPRGEGAIFTDLPDACVCLIVSYLSPKDVARGACVCQGFRNTLDSDNVWDLFLPKPAMKVVALTATKKKMFTFLCKPFLLTDTLAYWLDQGTGGVCYSAGAKGLRVVWGEDNRYWEWSSRPGARWLEVASLREVCWFHTSGSFKCDLPPGAYTLSWRLQYERRGSSVQGWDRVPTEFSVSTTDGSQRATSHRYLSNWPDNARQQSELGDLTPVRLVEDNWFEFDAGEITVVDEAVTSLEFSMVETESGHWKSGIILDGVVLRPSALTRTTGRYLSVDEMGQSSLQNHEPGSPVEGHPGGFLDPRGRLGLPRRRGGVRLVHPNGPRPHFDAGLEELLEFALWSELNE